MPISSTGTGGQRRHGAYTAVYSVVYTEGFISYIQKNKRTNKTQFKNHANAKTIYYLPSSLLG